MRRTTGFQFKRMGMGPHGGRRLSQPRFQLFVDPAPESDAHRVNAEALAGIPTHSEVVTRWENASVDEDGRPVRGHVP